MSSDGDNSPGSAGGNEAAAVDALEARKHGCTAVNERTGEICGETEGLGILDQFRKIYEDRMEKIEEAEAETGTATDFVPMKLDVMKEWIKDLGEQNVMLVRTVEDLERAARYRVKVLEEKLGETAAIASEKMSGLTRPGRDTVGGLSLRIHRLEKEEETLLEKIEFLKSDVRGLLELIRRARCENCWSLEGIKFFEVRPDDIPSPTECSCAPEVNASLSDEKKLRLILELDGFAGEPSSRSSSDEHGEETVESLKRRLRVVTESEETARKYQAELRKKVCDLDGKLLSREETIRKYISMLESLRDNLKKRSEREPNRGSHGDSRGVGKDPELDIVSIVEMVESAMARRSQEDAEEERSARRSEDAVREERVEDLRTKLDEKSLEIERLSRRLSVLEKESLETREALTNEVAEKHDAGIALRGEVAALEEQCRRANMLVQFKEDIIKGMRRELKERSSSGGGGGTKEAAAAPPSPPPPPPTSSGRRVRINAELVSCEREFNSEERPRSDEAAPSNRIGSGVVADLRKARKSWKRENEALGYVRSQLEEVLEELRAKERENYERDMATACTKLKDIGDLLDNYNSRVIDCKDAERVARRSEDEATMGKLSKSIVNLSRVCAENCTGIGYLEQALEKSQREDDGAGAKREARSFDQRWKWDAFDRQFNAMEEFRVCTVEAQAATENLREEMEIAVGSLQTRHQRYVQLCSVVKEMENLLTRTREDLSRVTRLLEKEEEERIGRKEKVFSGERRLKDMKNELNEARAECCRDETAVDAVARSKNGLGETIDEVVDVVERVVSHLRSLRSQDERETRLLSQLGSQLSNVERNLERVARETGKVLSDDELGRKIFNEKLERLDKFEKELDYAHTRMRDTLESIVRSKRRMMDVGVCNLCSCAPSDPSIPEPETTSRNEQDRRGSSLLDDRQRLKDALRSKERLLEDKDEIIKIQKDSIAVTHIQLKDLREEMRAKIDAQKTAISRHIEEKRLLTEQSKLQSETIGHLREAVVEAKRCLATKQRVEQKPSVDLSASETRNSTRPVTPTIFDSGDVHDV